MGKKFLKTESLLALSIAQSGWSQLGPFYAPRFHNHNHDHNNEAEILRYMNPVIQEGRIQVYEPKLGFGLELLPPHLAQSLQPVDMAVLGDNRPDPLIQRMYKELASKFQNPQIKKIIDQITESSYRESLTSIVEFGNRATLPASFVPWAKERFHQYGYEPFYDYNIVAFKEGLMYPDEHIVLIGHMDTVRGTIGADDNASGAAGVFEAARVLQNVKTKRSITFILSEDEEVGLLGAQYFIDRMNEAGNLARIKKVINMDMIAYNSNGIFDLETAPAYESFADKMAELAMTYTKLTPNKVLNPWGSDHVPFIDAKIPALLTIEHWKTHTPCWHKRCDTLDTINFDYGKEITRLNVAALAEFAELIE